MEMIGFFLDRNEAIGKGNGMSGGTSLKFAAASLATGLGNCCLVFFQDWITVDIVIFTAGIGLLVGQVSLLKPSFMGVTGLCINAVILAWAVVFLDIQ